MKDLPVAAQQTQKGLFKGSNIVCRVPRWNAKISGLNV
jgi:hypothetical protein